jgi:cell wall-associated NlpC family hydrolase
VNSIAERARLLIGVPFVHQGQTEQGLDCIGLAAKAYNYPFSLVPAYGRDPLNGELERYLIEAIGAPVFNKPFPKEWLKEGDLVAMQYRGPVRHVGIVLNHPSMKGELSLIHTDSMVGKVTEHVLDFKWFRRIEKVWRLEK